MLSRVADEPLTVASHMVNGATAALGSEYTGLHVRCGGSIIPVAACNVSAVSYYDGLKGDIPRLLLAHMRTLRERHVFPGRLPACLPSPFACR
jgi:hypothetical protein